MIKNFLKIKFWFMRKEDIQKKKFFLVLFFYLWKLTAHLLLIELFGHCYNILLAYPCSNLNTFYNNSELASALIFAKKKKILDFKKQNNDQQIIKKKLLKMAQAGFSYDIAKKIINLKNEKEFIELEESTRKKII